MATFKWMKHNRPPQRLLRALFVLLMLASPSLFAFIPAEDVSLSDDAFHYQYWADGQHDGNYIEWWYFNLFDAEQDLQAVFTYLITDPEDLTRIGFAQVTAVAYTKDDIVSENDRYPPGSFSAAYDLANVQIETNSIQVVGSVYEIKGASRNGRVSWNLRYTRQAEPWYAAQRMRVGVLPWEQMDWLIYMPRAEVSGQVIVDGHVYLIQATPGYHDHNWGEWIPTDALWSWAQYSQPDLAFELGDFIGKPAGLASIDFQGQRTVFTKDQYMLVHTRWAFDPGNLVWYPTETILLAGNGSSALIVTIRAVKTSPLRGDLPFPLRDVIILEQTAHYKGQLWRRDPAGQWGLAVSFQGGGFKEYTTKHY